MTAWDDLQDAYDIAARQIIQGRDPDQAALDAIWDHCRTAICHAIGHDHQPHRFLHRYKDKVWQCGRCGTTRVTVPEYDTTGRTQWIWHDTDDVRPDHQ